MRRALCFFLSIAACLAQTPKEQPVALVIRAEGGTLLRATAEMALTARPGDILFVGDSLRAATGPISFLFCPERSLYTLLVGGQVVMDAKAITVKAGQLGAKMPAPQCFLPPLERNAAASQQHNGGSSTRALMAPDADPGTFQQRVAALTADQRTSLELELQDPDKILAGDATNMAARLARAGILEKYGLAADAAAEYKKLKEAWPDAGWVSTRLFTLDDAAAKVSSAGGPAAPAEPGKTYALLVGISNYISPDIRPLNFAHEDAKLMNEYLRSDRGGKLGDEEITLLMNEQATTAGIRNSFKTLLARAKKNDTVILLIATHGTVFDVGGKRGAYIVSHDSNPQDLVATALPMADVQKLIQEDLSHVGRVLAYVDVCRSGTIGTIPKNANRVNGQVEKLAEAEGTLFLFTASRANEVSYEGSQYGGGHGAFSFFLLEALNGKGDLNSDGNVVINELIEYTRQRVAESTADKQHPSEKGNFEGTSAMANNQLQGIAMKTFTVQVAQAGDRNVLVDTRSLERQATPGVKPVRNLSLREQVDFEEALDSGRILAGDSRSAFTALFQVQRRVKPPEYAAQANRLKTVLEDRGQQIILKYLEGDSVPQTKTDFSAGAAYFSSARVLTPESVYLESRETFCLGRMRIFDKDYQGAEQMLERAVRLDPEGAYSYNALGIVALEQARYDRAAQAFREAAKRAPYWAYPLHNLALAYSQMGNYVEAIRTYREAMRLAPRYAYLPYNLGLVYQRLNRRRDAEAAYKQAQALAPKDGMPLNALGYLNAAAGKRGDAERYYKQALALDPDMLVARHNLAVLLAERKDRTDDAIALWRENLAKDATHLPSRLSLARVLAEQGKSADAVTEYERVIKDKPDYVAARVALGTLQVKAGQRDAALVQLREAVRLQPGNLEAWEQIGDLEKAAGRTAEAKAAFDKALALAQDGSTKKRIRAKI